MQLSSLDWSQSCTTLPVSFRTHLPFRKAISTPINSPLASPPEFVFTRPVPGYHQTTSYFYMSFSALIVPVGVGTWADVTGSDDRVPIVTLLAALTVVPRRVMLTVLGMDEQDNYLQSRTGIVSEVIAMLPT